MVYLYSGSAQEFVDTQRETYRQAIAEGRRLLVDGDALASLRCVHHLDLGKFYRDRSDIFHDGDALMCDIEAALQDGDVVPPHLDDLWRRFDNALRQHHPANARVVWAETQEWLTRHCLWKIYFAADLHEKMRKAYHALWRYAEQCGDASLLAQFE